jgi:drug/metabolite transporter (DMT)-like permease
MNYLLIVFYVLFAVSGSTLIKLGGILDIKKVAIPFIEINISWITFLGFVFYGLSFITYTILLNKFELSFISPLTVAFVYILLMITSFLIFKEPITFQKIAGSALILLGVILMLIKK